MLYKNIVCVCECVYELKKFCSPPHSTEKYKSQIKLYCEVKINTGRILVTIRTANEKHQIEKGTNQVQYGKGWLYHNMED